MNIESPALGKSAGLEYRKVENKQAITTTTVFDPPRFQSSRTRLRKPFRYCFSGRRLAFRLLRQVQNLVIWRLSQGIVLSKQDRHQITFILAALLAAAPPSKRKRKVDPVWHSLDYVSLTIAVEDARMEPLDEAETMAILHKVLRYREARPQQGPMTGQSIGKKLGVLTIEREGAQCWNILPIDQTKTECNLLRKQKKLAGDRELKRAEREGKHESRAEYLAKAGKRTAFREAYGIADKTVQRWIKAGQCRIEPDGTITLVSR